jgi:hypothetical protein
MNDQKIWEINICQIGTVDLHYKTDSLRFLREGFLGLAKELRDVADELEALDTVGRNQAAFETPCPSSMPPLKGEGIGA